MTPTTSAFQRGMTPSTSDALQRGFTPTYISHSQRSPIDPIYQAPTNPLTYQAQQSSPARQKPDFGSFAFARLPYLDSRVSRCYGCGELLKPGGVLPPPPNDLVMTTRLHRKYYKDGQLCTSSPTRLHTGIVPLTQRFGSISSNGTLQSNICEIRTQFCTERADNII